MEGVVNWFLKNNEKIITALFGISLAIAIFWGIEPRTSPLNQWFQTRIPVWLAIMSDGISGIGVILSAHGLLKSAKLKLALALALTISGPSFWIVMNRGLLSGILLVIFLGVCVLYWPIIMTLRSFLAVEKSHGNLNDNADIKGFLDWFLKNKEWKATITLFLLATGVVIFWVTRSGGSHQFRIPIWLAIIDIAVLGTILTLSIHKAKLPKYITIPIAALIGVTYESSISILMKTNKILLAGVILTVSLGVCALSRAMTTILKPFSNLGERRSVPKIKGSWPDEFEHLKVKEEVEYELSQKFPGYWDKSAHYSKHEKLKHLEEVAREFDEKYGHQKMALIVEELKKRLES